MLSGGKRWKTNVQYICTCTFLCRRFVRLQRETIKNFLVTLSMEEMSYLFSFTFFHCRSFSPCFGGPWHFSFCQRRYKISIVLPTKNASFVFSRWASLACRPLSLSFSCSIFQFCGHYNLFKLNTLDKTDTETISAVRFRLYWLLLSLLYKTTVTMRIPAKITSSCIWVAKPVDWVILHWYACGADRRSLGRAVSVRSRDY